MKKDKYEYTKTEEGEFEALTFKQIKEKTLIDILATEDIVDIPEDYTPKNVLIDYVIRVQIERKTIKDNSDPVLYIHVNENYHSVYSFYPDEYKFVFMMCVEEVDEEKVKVIVSSHMKELDNFDKAVENIGEEAIFFINYVSYFIENRSTRMIQKEVPKLNTSSTNNKNKSNSRREFVVLNDDKVVYTYKERLDNNKRVYDRRTGSWQVTGHFRHYKDGRAIWIKPFKKGEGKEKAKRFIIK